MTRPAFLLIIVVALILFFIAVDYAHAQQLPKPLPTSRCSTLNHLHGKALWKHWVWHLAPKQYRRICRTINAESRWNPRARNGQYRGLAQFSRHWYAGCWRFNAYDPVTSIRVMVYMLRHPRATGGWANWYPH